MANEPIEGERYLLIFAGEIMAEALYSSIHSKMYTQTTFMGAESFLCEETGIVMISFYWPDAWIRKTENIKIW
jgi:hypothetical protein